MNIRKIIENEEEKKIEEGVVGDVFSRSTLHTSIIIGLSCVPSVGTGLHKLRGTSRRSCFLWGKKKALSRETVVVGDRLQPRALSTTKPTNSSL